MIVIDMKKPEICAECPAVHLIQSGEYEGRSMCCVKEYQGKELADTIVDEFRVPEGCPMREVRVV